MYNKYVYKDIPKQFNIYIKVQIFLRATPAPSPSFIAIVLERIKFRSVRMLGRRAFGATTPQASLKRRLIESAFFFDPPTVVCGGKGDGAPNTDTTRRW